MSESKELAVRQESTAARTGGDRPDRLHGRHRTADGGKWARQHRKALGFAGAGAYCVAVAVLAMFDQKLAGVVIFSLLAAAASFGALRIYWLGPEPIEVVDEHWRYPSLEQALPFVIFWNGIIVASVIAMAMLFFVQSWLLGMLAMGGLLAAGLIYRQRLVTQKARRLVWFYLPHRRRS